MNINNIPAKKAAKKVPAKKVPAKPTKPAKPKAAQSNSPIDPNREKKNGVLHPAPRTIGGTLWEVCDKLTEKLGRAPARFEYREQVDKLNAKAIEKGGKAYDVNSVSFQYFAWRKFHGVPARASGLFPKRGSFDLSTKPQPKKAPVKKAKAAVKVAVKVAKKAPKTPPAKPTKPAKPKAAQSNSPIDPNREKKNGVLHPAPRTIGGTLWEVCDKLTEKLGRAPARFEYREQVDKLNAKAIEKGGKAYDVNSVSFQYFAWRKFHGVPARASGLFPKRGSFDLSTKPEPKNGTPEAKDKPAKKAAKVKTEKPAPVAKKAAKKAVSKKTGTKAPAKAPDAPTAPPAAPGGTSGVSSRLAGVSEAATHSA